MGKNKKTQKYGKKISKLATLQPLYTTQGKLKKLLSAGDLVKHYEKVQSLLRRKNLTEETRKILRTAKADIGLELIEVYGIDPRYIK